MSYTIKRVIFDAIIFAYLLFVGYVFFVFKGADHLESFSSSVRIVGLLFVGSLIAGFALYKANTKTLGELLFAPPHRRFNQAQPKSWYKTFWGVQTLITLFVTVAVGYIVTEVDLKELVSLESIQNAKRLFVSILNPDWALLPQATLKIIETIFIAFMATLVAVPVAFVLSFFCAKNIMGTTPLGYAVYMTLRTIFNISRSIEPILWAIIFSVWVGFGPYAGMLALMIHSMASLAKQYSEMVESIDEGPIEGIRSSGANFVQTLWFAVVPQVVLPYISFTIYRWDINVRMATIIGFVGGGGIGELLLQHQRLSNWPQVGCIIVVIAIIVWVMDNLSAYVREAIK